MISVTKIFRFEAAHILSDYNGDCKNIHGHSYELHVSVRSKNNSTKMVVDFKELKSIVKKEVIDILDHTLMLKDSPVHIQRFGVLPYKTIFFSEEPTVEFLIHWISEKLNSAFGPEILLSKLILFETADSYATKSFETM